MLEINKIYNMDCLLGMKQIKDCSIDMILCDLPYGVLNKQSKHDTVIPFKPLWEQYNRIIKNNGAIILFGSGMFTADCMQSNPKLWRYNLIWKKGDRTSGFLNANRMPLRNHEDIIVFYKQQPIYNPQFTYDGKSSHKKGKKGISNETNNCYGSFEVFESRDYGNRKFPKSVLNFDRDYPPIHQTQKPLSLCEYLIRTYTNEGELILDNCIGSGTSAISAINTNRNYIGFELDATYYNIANERIEKHLESKL